MSTIPRNQRNNNPGNIRLGGSNWDGSVTGNDTEFVTFATPEMGVRAMVKTLHTYQDRYNLSSIREIISRWAPYGENDTGGYIDFVSKNMGIDPDLPLELKKDPAITEKLVTSMIKKEGGVESYDYFKNSITKGIKIANTSSGAPVTVATVANHEGDDRFDGVPKPRGTPDSPRLSDILSLDTSENRGFLSSASPLPTRLTVPTIDPLSNAIVGGGNGVTPHDRKYPNKVNTDTKPSEVPQLKQEIPFFSGSDFATLKEVVNAAEEHEIFWYNELDNYENYSYHLELFMVPKEDADRFNEFGVLDFEKTITGGWPEESVNKVTIAQSATTTEFNIDNLTLENLGTGSGSVAKMVGVDSHLSFDIIQIGNTSLNDTLHTFANLMGYPNIGTAVYFIKISYKGYDNDNPKNSTKLPIVKVIPFLITSYNELSTTTNATGTTTSLTGTSVNYIASTHVINTTKHDLKFDIKPTLNETLNSFVTELNKTARLGTGYNESQTRYFNNYKIEFSANFKERFAESKMNNELANKSSASTEIARRTADGFNIAKQIGQVTAGVSIAHLLYDICIQSSKVKDELLIKNPSFSYAVRIIPKVEQKEFNLITNKSAYEITYYITMHREIIIQDIVDQSIKISETRKLLSEIFDKGRCRKLYNYEYTGLNDQILDLTVSLDRQLVKSYGAPGDEYSWNRFLKGNTDLSNILTKEQFAKYREVTGLTNEFDNKLKRQSTDLENTRSDLLRKQDELFEITRNKMIAAENKNITSADDAIAVSNRYQNIDSYADMAELQRINPDLFTTVRQANISENEQNLRRTIEFLGSKEEKSMNDIKATKSSISDNRNKVEDIENTIAAQYGVAVNDAFKERQEFNKRIRSDLLKPINGIILAEELGADLFSDSNKLSDTDFASMMDALSLNSITFERDILSNMRNGTTISSFSSTDLSNVSLARSKFNESLNADLSMQRLDMTIKGDPFWVEYYVSEKTKEEKYGENNSIDGIRGHNANVNGTNYMMLVVNKADGVDEFDNIKIDNLDIFLYMVQKIKSSFSRGEFTQNLQCIRQPIPSNFKSTTVPKGTIEGDGTGGRGDPRGFGDLFGRGGGNGASGSGKGSDVVAGIPSEFTGFSNETNNVANGAFKKLSGSLSSLAGIMAEASPFPTAEQASRLTTLLNEAELLSNNGSTEATKVIADIKSKLRETFGPPEEASDIFQELADDGTPPSPELIALLNTKIYDGETIITPTTVDQDRVTEIMSEIENITIQNTNSVTEMVQDISGHVTQTVDTRINTETPTQMVLENSNMMLDGSLPLHSTEEYKDPNSPVVDYNPDQLAALDLPVDVVEGYRDAAATRNGIKVRKYIDSLPEDQAELLNSIDNPYTVKTLPYDAPTIETIAATPLKTPREAIMQARIEDAQTQMIAAAGGSYNDLSADEKRHYENLSDAYDAIDEAAQLDPIRNESKLIKINNELDKSIRIYNDRLAGGDSEWSWTQEEAEEKTQIDNTVLENISNLDNAHSTPIADRVIVDDSGNVNIMKDMSVLPVKPSDGFTLPMDYLTDNDEFVITDPHLAQYELAEKNWVDFRKGEFVTVNVVDPASGKTWQIELYSSFENPELAQQYGIDTTTVVAGETISQDDPRYTQWAVGNLSNIRNQIVNELPLVTTVEIHNETAEESKKLKVPISINDFVLLEGEE
jgi:hypothetical protein